MLDKLSKSGYSYIVTNVHNLSQVKRRMKMKKTIRNNADIASCVNAIGKMLPALKETEVIPYCYHIIAQDIVNCVISPEIWDSLPKLSFKIENITFSETRGVTLNDEDYTTVANFYLSRPNVKRAPLAYMTKLVLLYTRNKLEEATISPTDVTNAELNKEEAVKLLSMVNSKAAELIISGKLDKIMAFLND